MALTQSGAPRRRVRVGKRSDLEKRDVDGLGALVALLFLVGHPGALGEGAIPVAVDAREVDEQVTAALGGRDEAVPLVVAEPLDGADRHLARTSTELRSASAEAACATTRTRHDPAGAKPTPTGRNATKTAARSAGGRRRALSRRAACPRCA